MTQALGMLIGVLFAAGCLLVIFAPRRRQPPVPALPARDPEPPRRVRRVIFEEITEDATPGHH